MRGLVAELLGGRLSSGAAWCTRGYDGTARAAVDGQFGADISGAFIRPNNTEMT